MKSRTLISFCQRPVLNPFHSGNPFSRAVFCEALLDIVSPCGCACLSLPDHLNPSNEPVCRAIISSSLVGITHAETLLFRAEIRGPLPALASLSSSRPSHAEASHIRRRISGEF